MTDKITKLLSKLSKNDLSRLKLAISKILSSKYEDLDIKVLKSHKDIFRVRVGNYRIIFRISSKQEPEIISISRRNEKTYKDF